MPSEMLEPCLAAMGAPCGGGGGPGGNLFGGGGSGGKSGGSLSAPEGPPASSFGGSRSNPLTPPAGTPPRNPPGSVGNVPYSGHAFDQMRDRGIPPSVTNNAILNGIPIPSQRFPGTTGYYDPDNNLTVITDDKTGTVITVIPGQVRP
jgi:filamentous hemagglutinin